MGGSGSGKSTLARRLGTLLETPIHHLDDVAREGGTGRIRPETERLAIATQIAASPRWVTDGIHVGWTHPLCERADVIVWLDQVRPSTAMWRVLKRFVKGGVRESRRQRGLRRFFRPRSYAHHLIGLFQAGREIRDYDRMPVDAEPGDGGSHAATEAQLAPYRAKVVHCRQWSDIEAFVADLEGRTLDRKVDVAG